MRIMSPVMVGYTQFLNFSFYDASVAFNYESFTFSGNSLKTYMETQQFYGNEKWLKSSELENLAGLGQLQFLELLYSVVDCEECSVSCCFSRILWRALCRTLTVYPLLEEERWWRPARGSCTHNTSSRLRWYIKALIFSHLSSKIIGVTY